MLPSAVHSRWNLVPCCGTLQCRENSGKPWTIREVCLVCVKLQMWTAKKNIAFYNKLFLISVHLSMCITQSDFFTMENHIPLFVLVSILKFSCICSRPLKNLEWIVYRPEAYTDVHPTSRPFWCNAIPCDEGLDVLAKMEKMKVCGVWKQTCQMPFHTQLLAAERLSGQNCLMLWRQKIIASGRNGCIGV